MRAPIPRPPPHSLRRSLLQRATPTHSPPTALLSPPLSTPLWPWEWAQGTSQCLQPFISQKDSETVRGKGRIKRFLGSQESLDWFRQLSSLSLCPWQLSASGSIAWTSARPQNQACSKSSHRHLNANRPIITSNSISFYFSLTFTVGLNQSGTGPGRIGHWCDGLPYCARSRQTMDTFSLVIKSHLCPFTCLCLCLQRF